MAMNDLRYLLPLAALFIYGCATPPPPPPPKPQSYAVLLENPDGSSGRIMISNSQGETVIDKPRYGANLAGAAGQAYAVDDGKIKQDFGAALAARPPLPESFLLYFEVGGTQLTPESKALIARILDAVKNHPAADVSIIGHTDTVGTPESNEALGLSRAQAVAQLIQSAGLKAHEVTVTSHGERNLLVGTPDNTPEPRNRRVEITVR